MKLTRKIGICLMVLTMFFYVSYSLMKGTYSSDDEELTERVINGEIQLTYELFGAKGDGVTNDYLAIKGAHDFANQLYINEGILPTVYACDSSDCSDKVYYIGSSDGNGSVKVITNVDWKKANFIIDDYIDDDGDGVNDVTTTESLFDVTTPLRMYARLNNASIITLTYNSDVLSELSDSGIINPNTNNLKELIDALYNGKVNVNAFYNNNVDEIEKYFYSSQRWMVFITNSNKQFIRKGSNSDSGYNQSEMIIIDSSNGDVLTNINWTYDDITEIKVYPVPDTQISIGNGNFTTRTNNVVYTTDDNGNVVRSSYSNRNIYISYSGNVRLHNINHYLDEEMHTYTNDYQSISSGNMYYGFVRIHNSSYVNVNNTYLTPHSYTKMVSNGIETTGGNGTYDLIIDNSVNVFLDNLNYACDIYLENGAKNYNQCYKNSIINEDKWGIMASNTSKNIFITNSKMNRIDAHRGVTNLYVSDTTVGVGFGLSSLTLTGNGYFYGNNLKIDSANHVLKLRDDYGSTWNGTMVFDNLDFIVNKNSTYPMFIYSNNEENWDFGYTTYFPSLYINGLNIDTITKGATNVGYVTFLELSKLYNGRTTIDKSNIRNLYNFKGNIYLSDLTTNGNTFKLFSNNFINSSVNTLDINNYGGNNIVNLYLDNDVSVDNKLASSNNTKFSVVDNMDNDSQKVRDYFVGLKDTAKMPSSLKPIIGNIILSDGNINEKIENDITDYSVTVDVDSITIDLNTAYVGTYASWKSKTFDLVEGDNIIKFSVMNNNNESTDYILTITKINNDDTEINDDDVLLEFDNNLDVDEEQKFIKYLNEGIIVSEMLEKVHVTGNNTNVFVYNKTNNVKSNSEVIASGDTLAIYQGDIVKNEYKLSVLGDASGDGKVNLIDLVQLRMHSVSYVDINTNVVQIKTGVYYYALDMNKDGTVNLIDLVRMRRKNVGLDQNE